jgi:HD-GYP domain-containing protein (c-di-GMP phosphodiesterase class II)/HAMP domain-containing protein
LKLPNFREIKHSFLRSKVARRIFFLFILCALIPLSALAYLSFSQVTKQLYSQAEKQLHQISKSSGMTIFERLLFLETDFEMISTSLQKGKTDILDSFSHELRTRLKERFKGIVLITNRERINPILGGTHVLLQLSEDERQHVNSGKTLVLTHHGTDKFSTIYMVKALEPAHSLQTFLLGEINPEYLWGGEGFLSTMTELFAFDQSNNLLFSSYSEYIPLQEMKSAIEKNPSSGQFTWMHGDNTYLANYWTVFMNPHFHTNWIMLQNQSKTDILAPISTFKKIFQLLVILTFFIVLLLSFSQIKRSLVPIELLREATRRIAAKDFKKQIQIKTNDEFEELGAAFNEMTASLDNHFQIMTTLNRIGIALSAEKNNNHLLELILISAKNIINADGCALYTLTEDKQLKLSVMHIDSINLVKDGTDGILIPLYDMEGNSNTSIVAAYSVLKDKTVNVPDIYTAGAFDFSGNRDFDRQIRYKSQSFLSVLLKNHENEILGVLQLINAQSRLSKKVIPFSDEDQRLLETLASQAAVALSKNKLIEDFKELFDSLVELIATAIDEKSPYTGDHCRRVPELTMMLAEAVSNKSVGNLKDFTLSEEERYELKIAALLHDCGKVTTPVHIADKATRLETIFDRIHMIDTRFEVLKRDMQNVFLHKKLAAFLSGNEEDLLTLEEDMRKTLQQIDDDRAFVRTCNNGEIIMDESRKERLKDIASKHKWINEKGMEEPIISEEENYMLTTASGTITPYERAIINKHVETTSKMLVSLHYPKSLRNVPLFAQSHHERMDGKGYPKGLTGEQIPIQSRIISIADIFEALTAKTRPYKKGRTLMEALFILGSMKQKGHIDPDIFDIFISEKVYLHYAEKYLSKEQIDDIILSKIPGYSLQHSN